jgi:hypothetical protein
VILDHEMRLVWPDVRGSKAPFWSSVEYFRSSPGNGHRQGRSPCLKGANTEHGWRGPGSGGHTIITGAKIFDFIDRTGLACRRIRC